MFSELRGPTNIPKLPPITILKIPLTKYAKAMDEIYHCPECGGEGVWNDSEFCLSCEGFGLDMNIFDAIDLEEYSLL